VARPTSILMECSKRPSATRAATGRRRRRSSREFQGKLRQSSGGRAPAADQEHERCVYVDRFVLESASSTAAFVRTGLDFEPAVERQWQSEFKFRLSATGGFTIVHRHGRVELESSIPMALVSPTGLTLATVSSSNELRRSISRWRKVEFMW